VDEDTFWRVIDGCRSEAGADTEQAARRVLRRHCAMGPSEILGFEQLWLSARDELYAWPLLDAATLMLGRVDDDDFMSVQDWILSHGRAVTRDVKDNPDALVELVADRHNAREEWFCGLPVEALIRTTGRPPGFGDEPDGSNELEGEPADLTDEGEMRRRYPGIVAYLDENPWIARPWGTA
jgi:Protein of unknown function (DUF4240)